MSDAWKKQRIKNNELYRAARQRENVVDWQPGEQQALIAKTLAEGKVTKCKPGAYTQSTFIPYVGDISETTIDRMLPVRRANMREYFGKGY